MPNTWPTRSAPSSFILVELAEIRHLETASPDVTHFFFPFFLA